MVIVIAVRSVTLPGASSGIDFLFKPDFSKVTANTFLDALGQAFFSLSVGFGIIFTYASYVNRNENLVSMSVQTSCADTLFAIIAGVGVAIYIIITIVIDIRKKRNTSDVAPYVKIKRRKF